MSRTTPRRLAAPLIGAALAALLAGCSPAASTPDALTLAETKSPVQLLRNEAADRIPEDSISAVLSTSDESAPCRTAETDPEGLERQWRSTARFEIAPFVEVGGTVKALVASFVEQGWIEGTFGADTIIELTREGSETNIHITTKSARDEAGAQISVTVSGPCVVTEGKSSEDVVKLGPVSEAE